MEYRKRNIENEEKKEKKVKEYFNCKNDLAFLHCSRGDTFILEIKAN